MYKVFDSLQYLIFNLIEGQDNVMCMAGADGAWKLQFQIPENKVWMDYPNVAATPTFGAGEFTAANVYVSNFYAFSSVMRIAFAAAPTHNYWFSVAPVTMYEA